MKKIPKRFKPFIASGLMACMMSFIMSGIVTAINLGIPHDFITLWMRSFVRVIPIAFLAVLLVRPAVEHLVNTLFE